jgi:ABC-type multidrug transport system fused ATPase/permease subunit
LLLLTVSSFPFLYFSLELPKTIVNKAIGGSEFPRIYYGIEFNQIEFLLFLCALFLVLVGINGAFKYYVNVYKGQIGERMLRRLRYQLFSRVLRFPTSHFRRTSQGEIIAMITSEVEPLGGFIGDAFAQPAFQGGTLVTILFFMFVQDWVLGLAAIALYPLQMYVIPKLQRQVNLLAKDRVRAVRRLSERVGEAVSAVEEIHAHDTSEWHRADFARWVGTIYEIRFRIYRKKFFIKFLNNFIAQVTPFFFFSIGGYLVIKGDLTFGALVAVLAAYKDLSSPWKELLDWYQQKEDARVKYEQLVEQFEPSGMLPQEQQAVVEEPVPHVDSPVLVSNVTLEDDSGIKALDGVSLHFDVNHRLAVVGESGSGADALAKVLARLEQPSAGTVRFGEANLQHLPEAVTGRRLAYVGPNAYLLQGSVRDNLFYGLKHRPLVPAAGDPSTAAARDRYVAEAEKSGNTASDLDADWIDRDAAGVTDMAGLMDQAIEVLELVDLEGDLFAFGLSRTVDPEAQTDLAAGILTARWQLRSRLQNRDYAGLVESFDRARFNQNMSIAENLLFGTPIGPVFDLENIAQNAYVRQVLDDTGLTRQFLEIGLSVAKVMVDLFQGLPAGHEFFERFSFISAEALPEFQALIRGVESVGLAEADDTDRSMLLSLPFKLVPARHRLGLVTTAVEERILNARRVFAEGLPADLRGAIAFFNASEYNEAATVQDNILFGKLVYGRQQSQREVGALIAKVVDDLGLRRPIVELGLEFQVGIGGSRLSPAQRQKLALARGLIKRPDILILDQATVAFDPATQSAFTRRLLGTAGGPGIVWVLSQADDVEGFDRIVAFEAGRVVRQTAVADQRAPVAIVAPSGVGR